MAVKLMNLRNVPVDELVDIYDLLDSHNIEYYETTAGTFGISLAALWVSNDSQFEHARMLLDEYARQRFANARKEYESLRETNGERTFFDIARENPLRFILYVAGVLAVIYFSVMPFLQATEVTP